MSCVTDPSIIPAVGGCTARLTIMVPCPVAECVNGDLWVSRYGGNDPDCWSIGTCAVCGGRGQLEIDQDESPPHYTLADHYATIADWRRDMRKEDEI